MADRLISVDDSDHLLPAAVRSANDAATVPYTPTAPVTATDVQTAIEQVQQTAESAASAAIAAIGPAANAFIPLGDSISTIPGGGGYGSAWFLIASGLSERRLNYLESAGVTGDNSTQVLARVNDPINAGARVVSLCVGRNDITQGVSAATLRANTAAIVDALRAAGIWVVLCTIPPRSDATHLTETLAHNQWLASYAQVNGVALVDFFAVLADPATGAFAAGMGLDSVHPSPTGHVAMGVEFDRVVSPMLSPYLPLRALVNVGDAANLLSNPLLLSGSPTPTSWITSGTGGMTGVSEGVVDDTDFVGGKAYEIDLNQPSDGAGFRMLVQSVAASWSSGDELLFCCKIKILHSAGLTPGASTGARLNAGFVGGTPSTVSLVPGDSAVHGAALHAIRYVVPAGTTTVQLQVLVGGVPTVGGRLQARFGELALYNLSTLGFA